MCFALLCYSLKGSRMIITAAIMKGGVGKSTLLRVLASVAAHKGFDVTIIDADVRRNISRWVQMLEKAGTKPDNLHLHYTDEPEALEEIASQSDGDRSLVLIDTEGTTNDLLMAGLFSADLALVPVVYSTDEIRSAIQLVNNYIPKINEERDGHDLPAMYIETRRTLIDSRAGALKELREIISESGTPLANAGLWDRVSYKDLQAGSTLYTLTKPDPKAVAESEALFGEIIQYFSDLNSRKA